MDTESRSAIYFEMQAVRTWVNRSSTGCHIIVNVLLSQSEQHSLSRYC